VRALLSLLVFLLGALASGCTYIHGSIDYEKDVDFSKYESFALERTRALGEEPSVLAEDDAFVERVEEIATTHLREWLLEKGFVELPADEADLHIGFHLTARDEVHVSDKPGHERWLRVDIRDIAYDTYTRGTLVVDVSDRAQGLLIWHGVQEGVIKTMHFIQRLLVTLLAAATLACAGAGREFDTTHVTEVQKGAQDKAQIKAWFGEPFQATAISGHPAGCTERWTYTHAWSNWGGTQTTAKSLIVDFDANGVVCDHAFVQQ
jgi:outer membrane protein assembly factor BamE (lipoprotein component of BamABCDE complex)